MSNPVSSAVAHANARPSPGAAPSAARPARWFAVGDPQTSAARFFGFLERAGALGEDGWLHPDVGLVSIGDHFDYGLEADEAAREGMAILHWLAAQSRGFSDRSSGRRRPIADASVQRLLELQAPRHRLA